MKRWLGPGIALLLTACVDRTPTVPFSAEQAAFIKKTGTGVVSGHAFRTRSLGQLVNAAGQVVYLIPATPFSRERFTQLFGNAKYLPHALYPGDDNPDPLYVEHMRTTKAEANGRFTFDKVAPGEYFVTTQVTWGAEDAFVREGGLVYDTATITGKETQPVNVILSGY